MSGMEPIGTSRDTTQNDCFYESFTLCSFDNSGEEAPSVNSSAVRNGVMCIAVDNNITLVKCPDPECVESFMIEIDDAAECCLMMEAGETMLVASRSGAIYCYNQEECLFISTLPLTGCARGCRVNNIIESNIERGVGACSVLVIGCFGDIYRLSWSNNVKPVPKNAIHYQCLREGDSRNPISCALQIPSVKLSLALLGRNICVWNTNFGETLSLEDFSLFNFVKAGIWKDRFMVVLTNDAKLAVICIHTFLCCAVWDKIPVKDFVLSDSNTDQDIFILTKQQQTESVFVVLASLPDFQVKWKSEVSQSSWLVKGALSLSYVEGISSNGTVNKINVNAIRLTRPEQRLKELIKEKRFAEAEALALRCSLNVEFVLKEKTFSFLNTLAMQHDEGQYSDLVKALDRISDLEFISHICIKYYLYDLQQLKRFFRYGISRLKETTSETPMSDKIQQCKLELNSRLFKLETYELIKSNIVPGTETWQKIFNLKWLAFCSKLLEIGQIVEAVFVWERHLKCGPLLVQKEIIHLLNSVSPDVEETKLFIWLESIVPYIINRAYDHLNCFIDWGIQRASALEKQEDWPSSGVTFVGKLVNLLAKNITVLGAKMSMFEKDKESLLSFLSNLKEIQLLKDVYHINLPLKAFLKDDKFVVSQMIMEKVLLQDVDAVINGFMKNFARKHHIDMDKIVFSFVMKQLTTVSECWSHVTVDHWEPIISTYIMHIKNSQKKLDCILATLRLASVPWSKTISTLAGEGLKINLPQAAEVENLRKIVAIKLIFKKYGFDKNLIEVLKLEPHVSFSVIRRIILQAKSEMLHDALTVAGDSLQLQNECYSLCIDSYVMSGQEDSAINILKSLDQDTFTQCCERLMCRILAESDVNIMFSYISLVIAMSVKIQRIPNLKVDLEYMKNVYRLKCEYGCEVRLQVYSIRENRKNILKSCVQKIITRYVEKKCDFYSACRGAQQIAYYLQFSPGDGFLEVCYQLSAVNKDIQWNKIENPYEFSTSKLLSLSHKLLLSPHTHPSSTVDLFECVNWSLLQQHLNVDDPGLYVLPLLRQCQNVSNSLESKQINISKQMSVYQSGLEGSPNLLFEVLSDLYISLHQKDIDSFIRKIPDMAHQLLKRNMCVFLLSILNTCIVYFKVHNLDTDDQKVIKFVQETRETLLGKVVLANYFDVQFGLAVLFTCESNFVMKWLGHHVREFRDKYPRLERICKLGMKYNRQFKQEVEVQCFAKLYTECAWVKRLMRLNIVCCKTFSNNKDEYVGKIILSNDGDLGLVAEFCRAFGLNIQNHLPECLEKIILSWEPVMSRQTNAGETSMRVRNNEDGVVKKCLPIAEKMNKVDLEKCLDNIWGFLNYYYYEMYLCIDTLREKFLNTSSPRRLCLLFLKNYNRTRPVTEEEKELWPQKFPNSAGLPALAEWRLPFWSHDIGDAIKPELTLDNYERWLQVAKALRLAETFIVTSAIKQSVSELNANIPDEPWCTTLRNEGRISQIWKCVQHAPKMETRCAAMFHVANKIKPGADKVALFKHCSTMTTEWFKEVHSDTSKQSKLMAKKKYVVLASTQVLYTHELTDPCYLNAVTNPVQLIKELYQDPSIVNQEQSFTSSGPDINSAAREIAKIHDLVLVDLYLKMLREWLSPLGAGDRFDDTVTIRGSLQNIQTHSREEQDNFMRACYLLSGDENKALTLMLVELSYQDNECLHFKKNALLCITKVVNINELSNLFSNVPEYILHHLQNLTFVNELHNLGYMYTVAQFKDYDKEKVVRMLLENDFQNPSALQLAVQLAIEFKVFSAVTWKTLLKRMLDQRMYNDIEAILGHIPEIPEPELVAAWNQIIFTPFYKCKAPLSEEQEAECMHVLKLLQYCPVTRSLEIANLVNINLELEKAHWASLILPFLDEESQKALAEKISNRRDIQDVYLKLKDLERDFLMVPKVFAILGRGTC